MLAQMRYGANLLAWEVRRALKGSYFNMSVFFLQQLTWPMTMLIVLFFTYAPLAGRLDGSQSLRFTENMPLWTYLIAGVFVLNLFSEYVNIGFHLSFERDQGVLELIYLTPVPRMIWVLGNALSAIVSGLWSFAAFAMASFILFHVRVPHPFLLICALFFFLLASLPWGAFVIAVFLTGRNMRLFYALFETPAEFLAGVRYPIRSLPFMIFLLSLGYPISHAINLMRLVFAEHLNHQALLKEMGWLGLLAVIYLVCAHMLLGFAEKRGKIKGDLTYS